MMSQPGECQLETEGRILHRDWDKYDTAHVVFQPKHMSYLYKRSNRIWHLLIKHRLTGAVWQPLIEHSRRRHLKLRSRLERVSADDLVRASQCVSPGV